MSVCNIQHRNTQHSPVEKVKAKVRQHGAKAVADAVVGMLWEGDLLEARQFIHPFPDLLVGGPEVLGKAHKTTYPTLENKCTSN